MVEEKDFYKGVKSTPESNVFRYETWRRMYTISNSYKKNSFFSFQFFLLGGTAKDERRLLICKFGRPTSPIADDYTKKKKKNFIYLKTGIETKR